MRVTRSGPQRSSVGEHVGIDVHKNQSQIFGARAPEEKESITPSMLINSELVPAVRRHEVQRRCPRAGRGRPGRVPGDQTRPLGLHPTSQTLVVSLREVTSARGVAFAVPPPLIPVDQQGRLDILHGGHGLRAVSDGTRPHRCPTPAPPARSRASNNRAIPGPRRAEPSCLPASIYRPAGILLFPVQGVLPLLLHCGEADGQR
jgi:hypothetical protein